MSQPAPLFRLKVMMPRSFLLSLWGGLAFAGACERGGLESAPSSVTLVAGDRSIGPLTDSVYGTLRETTNPLVVLVLDDGGRPLAGVPVMWAAFGGGTVAPIAPVTNAGGESIAEYTFGWEARPGYGAVASVHELAAEPVVFALRAHAATPTRIEKTHGDTLTVPAGGQVVYTVTARDSYGNPTRGVRIVWAVTGGGSVSWPTTYTGSDGRSEVTRTLGVEPGEQTATAAAPDLRGAPAVTFTTRARSP
jgi:hypothetical protein